MKKINFLNLKNKLTKIEMKQISGGYQDPPVGGGCWVNCDPNFSNNWYPIDNSNSAVAVCGWENALKLTVSCNGT